MMWAEWYHSWLLLLEVGRRGIWWATNATMPKGRLFRGGGCHPRCHSASSHLLFDALVQCGMALCHLTSLPVVLRLGHCLILSDSECHALSACSGCQTSPYHHFSMLRSLWHLLLVAGENATRAHYLGLSTLHLLVHLEITPLHRCWFDHWAHVIYAFNVLSHGWLNLSFIIVSRTILGKWCRARSIIIVHSIDNISMTLATSTFLCGRAHWLFMASIQNFRCVVVEKCGEMTSRMHSCQVVMLWICVECSRITLIAIGLIYNLELYKFIVFCLLLLHLFCFGHNFRIFVLMFYSSFEV